MIRGRIKYLIQIILVIIVGLVSRQIEWIPLFVGDILYAVMMFFIVRIAVFGVSIIKTASIALIITYAIEFSKLYQSEWINNVRCTLLGGLVLGQGFLWSDLLAYAAGIFIISIISKVIERES